MASNIGILFKCISNNTRPVSDGWAGLRVTSILEAANRSLQNDGQREKLSLGTAMALG